MSADRTGSPVGLLAAGLASGLVAAVAVLSVRAQDAALAGLGLAATIGLLAILTRATPATVGSVDPAWTLALLLRGRIRPADLLPTWAAQAVGAVAAGALAGWIVDDLRQWSIIDQPEVVPAAIVVALVALAGAWTATAAATDRAPVAACGLPAVGAAAALPPTFAAAANPAALFALGVSGVAEWEYVFFTTLAGFGGAVVGSLVAAATPSPDSR
jgi:glycerol uptake facilitator-like aquaporin